MATTTFVTCLLHFDTYEVAILWLVQNKNPFHFDKPTGNIDLHEFRSVSVTKSLYLFLRNKPMVLKKYI